MSAIDADIIQAIDHDDTAAAGRVADALRARGLAYKQILWKVQRLRPEVSEAQWDAMIFDSEMAEASQ